MKSTVGLFQHEFLVFKQIFPVFRIRIRIQRILMFLGLPDPDPSIIKQKVRKTMIPTDLWLSLELLSLKNDLNAP